jgi:Ca2+-binding RTX toxin-like protein
VPGTLERLRAPRLIVSIVATTLVLGGMVVAESRGDPSPEARATRTAGILSISNSRSDRAVLKGSHMLPGDAVTGTVTIANTGSEAGLFELSGEALSDAPGEGGGVLSADLRLAVVDISEPSSPRSMYEDELGRLDVVPVGEIGAGSERTYRFTVTRPAGGPIERYRAATTSVDFLWSAVREETGRCVNRVLGSDRADVLSGSRQGDTISGGPGDDSITGLGGNDCLAGEEGNDAIDSRDGRVDEVDCGPGLDSAAIDPEDTVTGCERVTG